MQIVLVAGQSFMVSDFVVCTAFANVLQFYSRSACSQKATLTSSMRLHQIRPLNRDVCSVEADSY